MIYGYLCTPMKPMPAFKCCLCTGQVVMELIALGCLHVGQFVMALIYLICLRTSQVVMEIIIILAELERASLFAEASQLYSDLKFYFVLQIFWVWVKGYLV